VPFHISHLNHTKLFTTADVPVTLCRPDDGVGQERIQLGVLLPW